MKTIQTTRRGITLLFVISLIVLFLLMGTAFVVLASDFMRSSKSRSRVEFQTNDNSQSLVEQALYEVLRGPDLNDVNSPLRFHDILADQYGYGLRARVTSCGFVPNTNQQVVQISVRSPLSGNLNRALSQLDPTVDVTLDQFTESYAGCVLSFITGVEKGLSERVVFYNTQGVNDINVDPILFFIPARQFGENYAFPLDDAYLATLIDSDVIINNRDFSGTGPEFDRTRAENSPALGALALVPNRQGQPLPVLLANGFVSSNSSNEPWDAVDTFSNLFLAGPDDTAGRRFQPSFHRERLVALNGGNSVPPPASARVPSHLFSAFAVSNPLNPLNLVDTDNDGEPDAIWMDIGFPIQSEQGVLYKPLVAYKIVDLDGRFNLNAHGTLADAHPDFGIDSSLTLLNGEAGAMLPRGLGWGPAEISLRPLFGTTPAGLNDYRVLIEGDLANSGRYGFNNPPANPSVPGLTRNGIEQARAKMFGHPYNVVDWSANQFGTVGNLFAGSPMDLHGRFAIGTPVIAAISAGMRDDFRDLNFPGFPNAMPMIDMIESTSSEPEFSRTNYNLSFANYNHNNNVNSETGADFQYTFSDLEKVLRPNDLDSEMLARRLWNVPRTLSGGDESLLRDFWLERRDVVTTASFEVPLSHVPFERLVYRKAIQIIGGSLTPPVAANTPFTTLAPPQQAAVRTYVNNNLRGLFAPELYQGLKMNVNRPFGNGYDDSGDGIVDSPGEEVNEFNRDQADYFAGVPFPPNVQMDLNGDLAFNNDDLLARAVFAKDLYCLMMLVTDDYAMTLGPPASDEYQNYARIVAQWAVNVVDYRDADSIMTRFDYDPNPFVGGWSPTETVWGMERPELLITETMAAHARRLEGDPGTPEQRLRPEPFAFIELFNPHTQNSLNQQFDVGQYNPVTQGVELNRVNFNGDPVWRLRIDRNSDPAGAPAVQALRFVYFNSPGAVNREQAQAVDDGLIVNNPEVFYTDVATNPIRPGMQAVIGTSGRCYFGRLTGKTEADENPDNLELDDTAFIELRPATNQVLRRNFPNTETRQVAAAIPINRFRLNAGVAANDLRRFSVSDPYGGYPAVDGLAATPIPDGFRYNATLTTWPDAETEIDFHRNAIDLTAVLQQDRTSEGFRVIRLQRLANPTLPWNAATNPYLTIDSKEMDLLAFNGVRPSNQDPAAANPPVLTTNNLADSLERNNASIIDRQLWASRRGLRPGMAAAPADPHYMNTGIRESFGRTNDLFDPMNTTIAVNEAFPWLTWNNRPYASHLELMNVPALGSAELTAFFSMRAPNSPYTTASGNLNAPDAYGGNFGHLLNFFYQDLTRVEGNASNSPEFFRIFDFLEVPSRYAGTTTELMPVAPGAGTGFALNPFNTFSRYREPGKININTIQSQAVFEGLMGNYATAPLGANGLTWQQFLQTRAIGTNNENPFRPAGAGNYVPPGSAVFGGPQCTLFRGGKAGNPDLPLFDFTSTSPSFNSDRSAFFRNQMRQRLGNLVTTRSSVFAIWVTVGFFEVAPNGDLMGPDRELGIETGENRRHRGFFIFDRSIPVAYEPGQNHNIDNAILVRTIIE